MTFITRPGSSLVGFLFSVFASNGGSGDIAGMNGVGDKRGEAVAFPQNCKWGSMDEAMSCVHIETHWSMVGTYFNMVDVVHEAPMTLQ